MRFHYILDNIFKSRTSIKVLRFLIMRGKDASIREISREVKVAPPNVAKSLNSLYEEGILSMKKIGRSYVYAVKKENIFVQNSLIPIFREERAILQRLKEEILPLLNFRFESLIIFGSVARGDEDAGSDIDLAVIVKSENDKEKILEEILAVSSEISRRFGNFLSPIVFGAAKFKSEYQKNNPLFREIAKDGRVLAGKSISEIIINA